VFERNRHIARPLLLLLVLSASVLYMLPLLLKGVSFSSFPALLLNNVHDFRSTIVRTSVFAAITTSITTILGFSFALLLSRIPASSFMGRQMSWFLLPVILGNVSVAFVFKVCLFNTELFNCAVQSTSFHSMTLLGALQVWHFVLLFTYLFWINLANLDRDKLEYGHAVGMSFWEKLKDIIVPSSRNLGVLLLLIGFVFAFYEDAKNQFIFRASQGTHTELITHWLQREYQSKLIVNPPYAMSSALDNSLLVFALSLVGFIVLGLLCNFFIKRFCQSKLQRAVCPSRLSTRKINISQRTSIAFEALCLSAVFIPLIVVYVRMGTNLSARFFELGLPFVLMLIAAFLTTVLSITIAVFSRLIFRRTLQDLNPKSLLIFVSMFVLLLVPSLAVLLAGFQWLAWSGYNSTVVVYLMWISSHAVLLSPLLISFLLSVHFEVQRGELEYVSGYSLSFREIAANSFVKRFALQYLLLFIIACSFIWNEAIINSILSDRIPSFASRLQMMFMGRATDYLSASSYLAVSIVLAVAGILVWMSIVKRQTIIGR